MKDWGKLGANKRCLSQNTAHFCLEQQSLRALSVLPAKPDRFSEAAALAVSGQSVELLDQLLDAGLLEGVGEGWYHLHQAISDYARLQRTEIAPLQHLIQYARQMGASTNTSDVQDLDAEYPVVLPYKQQQRFSRARISLR